MIPHKDVMLGSAAAIFMVAWIGFGVTAALSVCGLWCVAQYICGVSVLCVTFGAVVFAFAFAGRDPGAT